MNPDNEERDAYAAGAFLPDGPQLLVNESGEQEAVLTEVQWHNASRHLDN